MKPLRRFRLLCLTAQATEPDEIAAEAADVMYFALVRCAAAGVSIADISASLDAKALKVKRRPGNAKAYRIAAAEAELGAKPASVPPPPPPK